MRRSRHLGWCPDCERWLCGMPRWLYLQTCLWLIGAWTWWVSRWEVASDA